MKYHGGGTAKTSGAKRTVIGTARGTTEAEHDLKLITGLKKLFVFQMFYVEAVF